MEKSNSKPTNLQGDRAVGLPFRWDMTPTSIHLVNIQNLSETTNKIANLFFVL